MNDNAIDNRSVIKNFMKITNTSEVFLYGGAAIDRYIDHNAKVMDYDIAISDIAEYTKAINNLSSSGFDVAKPRITHNLSVVAKHPQYGTFDLSCMDIEKNGIYNLEKFYIKYSSDYPNGKAVDRFDTVHSLREGRIVLVNNPDEEHAYDLLRRFSVLAGKYGFSLDKDGINKETISTIHRRLQETPLKEDNKHSRVRCLARFMGAVLRSKKQEEFLQGMGKTELMGYAYSEINNLLHDENFIASAAQKRFDNKLDLIDRMLEHTHNRDGLVDELLLLTQREKDREDAAVISRVEALGAEKTSLARLDKNIVSPVFTYVISGKRGGYK